MNQIVGITVCVNYGELLEITLPNNAQRLDYVYVITKSNDIKTIETCEKIDNAASVLYDFKIDERWFETHMKRYKCGHMNTPPDMRKQFWDKRIADVNKKSFNKGGGLRAGQKYALMFHPKAFQLIMDCDIMLPEQFQKVKETTNLQDDVLYVPSERRDYTSMSEYHKQQNYKNYSTAGWGYFQMYRPSDEKHRVFYDDWPDAAKTDVWFRDDIIKKDFSNKISLDTHVDHLGEEGKSIHYKKYNFDFE